MKVLSDESIYFDGEFVSNGKWAAHKAAVKIKGSVGELIKMGKPFTYRNKNFYFDDRIPDIAKVMEKAVPAPDSVYRSRSSLLYELRTNNKRSRPEYGRIFMAKGVKPLVLNERFVQGLGIDGFDVNADGNPVCAKEWIVMPIALDLGGLVHVDTPSE